MSKTDHKQNIAVPRLRFPEFKGLELWDIKPFKKVFTRITAKNLENNQNVLTISAQQGLVSQLDYFNKSVSARDVSGYYLLHKGDFAYNKSYSQGYPMGAIKPLKYYEKGVVSTLYICFRAKPEYSINFFEQYFDAGMLNKEIEKIAQEGARNHGLLNISVSEFFEKLELLIPELKEQKKIADCLSSIDELITAQAKKIESLQKHKKGLMQQLFPAEDETVPRVRFPEFKGLESWDIKPFKKVFTRITAKNLENNQNVLTISAQQGLISQLDYFNKSVSARDVSGYYLLHKGDFAYNKSYSQGYPMGAIKPLKYYEKGVVSTLYICFRAKPEYNISFFEQYFDAGMLNKEIEKIAQEGARNHGLLNISVSEFFEKLELLIPELEEQQKIADCLSSLDKLIAVETQKLDLFKTHKKGLMQQLFPAVDKVVI